ncbi:MAG: hypothetical protein HC927_05955 [Deltaproteobacteria bacterium]|nr:hypothetical protein [Deltaproteobacteria bacterium]
MRSDEWNSKVAELNTTLESLQKQQLITIQDAAVVSWPEGKKNPKTCQLHNMAGVGALGGAFWGMLCGESTLER